MKPLVFGEPGAFRDEMVRQILAGEKTGSSNLRVVYEMWGEQLPQVGELYALLDSTDSPAAVIRITEVVHTTSPEVTPELAAHESPSVEHWRDVHREFWLSLVPSIRQFLGDPEWELTDDEPVVSKVFELVRPVGVIGAGFHATTNILPASVLAGLELGGLATRDVERSRAALLKFGSLGTPFASADELLADDAVKDVVIVAQPADQATLTRQAIAAGRNVFVDKPLGWTSAEAKEIADEAEAAGTVVMVGFMKRYAPVYLQLKQLIESGDLGTVRSFHVFFGCDSTPFCATEEDYLKLASIHMVDLVRFLFGEAADVHTLSRTEGSHVALAVTLRFASGVVGTMELLGTPAYSSETEVVRVSGDRAHVTVTDVARLTLHEAPVSGTATWRTPADRTETFAPSESAMSGVQRDLFLRGFVGELEAFAAAAASGVAPTSSAADNVATMELCERILAHA